MVVESIAVIVVIGVMAAMYLRAGKGRIAGLAMLLLCLPAAQLLAVALWGSPGADGDAHLPHRLAMVGAGLLLNGALCLLFARKIPSRRDRIGYLFLGLGFTAALAVAYAIYLL